ncbi:MAG: hypothetical protein E7490_07015 [Ruminococcaceae bacterium]|nr:hypothetical protein [Oscillospiraceae bacterium]
MNAFHIFCSSPFFAKNKGKELIIDKTEVYCTVLSALSWREKNGSIAMITDKEGENLFTNIGITDIWDSFDSSLSFDSEEIDPIMFWAGGKLLALQKFSAPCVMIDTDFIVWNKLTFDKKLIAAHEEYLNPSVYPDINTFDMVDYTFPDGLDYTLPALNTAFLYMPDEDFKQYYTSQAVTFMKKAKRGGDYLTYMVFAEQRLLPMLAKKCGIEYTTLLDKDALFLPQNSYTHLWGAKQAMRDDKTERERFLNSCRERIVRSYPDYSYLIDRIEDFYGNNSGR